LAAQGAAQRVILDVDRATPYAALGGFKIINCDLEHRLGLVRPQSLHYTRFRGNVAQHQRQPAVAAQPLIDFSWRDVINGY
jgi:hypothetical protein